DVAALVGCLASFFANARIILGSVTLFHRLAAAPTDLGVELRAVLALDGLATFFADLGVELPTSLAGNRLTAHFADPRVELTTVLLLDGLAAFLSRLPDSHFVSFASWHVPRTSFSGCANCLSR